MPATPRQRRYDHLMGGHEPKVTDKKFVQELQHRIENKYLDAQQAKEKQLAETEKKRMRKLVLEGVVDPAELRAADAKSKDDEWREFWPLSPNKTRQQYEEERRRAEEQKMMQEQAAEEERKRQEEEKIREQQKEAEQQRQQEEEQQQQQQAAAAASGKYNRAESARIKALREETDLNELYSKASELVYIMAPVKK